MALKLCNSHLQGWLKGRVLGDTTFQAFESLYQGVGPNILHTHKKFLGDGIVGCVCVCMCILRSTEVEYKDYRGESNHLSWLLEHYFVTENGEGKVAESHN